MDDSQIDLKPTVFNELIALAHTFTPEIVEDIKIVKKTFSSFQDYMNLKSLIEEEVENVSNSHWNKDILMNYFNPVLEKIAKVYFGSERKSNQNFFSTEEMIKINEHDKKEMDILRSAINSSLLAVKPLVEKELQQIIEQETNNEERKRLKIEQREFMDLAAVIDSQNLTISHLLNDTKEESPF